MITNENKIEKLCAIYASDFHLEMMILPYINKKIEENEKVIIMTDKDIEDTVKVVLSNININEDRKNEILKLNWKNDDLNKFRIIKEELKADSKINIFIKGKENYINNVNKNIEEWLSNLNVKVINCYELDEISGKIESITNQYNKILNTIGEEKI